MFSHPHVIHIQAEIATLKTSLEELQHTAAAREAAEARDGPVQKRPRDAQLSFDADSFCSSATLGRPALQVLNGGNRSMDQSFARAMDMSVTRPDVSLSRAGGLPSCNPNASASTHSAFRAPMPTAAAPVAVPAPAPAPVTKPIGLSRPLSMASATHDDTADCKQS